MRPSTALPVCVYPTSSGYWVWHPRLAPRTQTTRGTPTARDSNLDSGNHGMSKLSALAYPNDAPIHGLADIRLAYCQRVLGVASWPLHPRTDTHNTTTLATQTPSWPPNDRHESNVGACRSPLIHLAAAPFCSAHSSSAETRCEAARDGNAK
jgi:hypothetical protein